EVSAASRAMPGSTAPVAASAAAHAELSDSQVLRVLEASAAGDAGDDAQAIAVPMVRKLDSFSLQALRKDLKKNLPVSFAVQLIWSPAPINVSVIAPLAIFRAYTLYTVGCLFEGRKWYGLRLGFFSDALSAKQVAQYVRSEYPGVAVVPVSSAERAQADASGGIDIETAVPVKQPTADRSEEITLLPDTDRPRPAPAAAPAANTRTEAAAKGAATTAGHRVLERGKGRTGQPRTLEETLEILGASQLTIENARGERLSLTGRHAKITQQKPSTFSTLLDRLADKLRG
ncbi:MAG: hypothetical protein NZM12_05285, partial [Steroidobacteraceae bacterium]|nr:hypothetical protein [Steroidobacteraceae bacterium]MDW8259054.1 hypothetical protein [Gammaproteobacteria bacterium]